MLTSSLHHSILHIPVKIDTHVIGRLRSGRVVLYAVDGRIVMCFCIIRWRRVRSLLLAPPDDHHAGGVGGRQETLVAVEADVEHRAAVTLQLVHDRLRVSLHVEEVNAGVLAAGHSEGGGDIRKLRR